MRFMVGKQGNIMKSKRRKDELAKNDSEMMDC